MAPITFMNEELRQIPQRIFKLAIASLTQANTHAVYVDPRNDHWDVLSILNSAHAGELFLKTIIALEHPLLIFREIFSIDDGSSPDIDLSSLLQKGRTHDFERLPQALWVSTGIRLPNPSCYERLRRARNSIQHFCAPKDVELGRLSLEFIYTIIDPLIYQQLGICAINFHENPSVGYDYIAQRLIRESFKFSMPDDFGITEFDLADELKSVEQAYRCWFAGELERIGKTNLLKF
ncbi:hypothetical protein [Blastochloris sulfoviridis]|nr:hypothetical protein [Blastochloris sulfoviridis]